MWDSVSGSRADFIFAATTKTINYKNTQGCTKEDDCRRGLFFIRNTLLNFVCTFVSSGSMVLTSSSDLPKRAYAEPCEQASKTYCQHGAARGCMTGLIFVVLAHEGEEPDTS